MQALVANSPPQFAGGLESVVKLSNYFKLDLFIRLVGFSQHQLRLTSIRSLIDLSSTVSFGLTRLSCQIKLIHRLQLWHLHPPFGLPSSCRSSLRWISRGTQILSLANTVRIQCSLQNHTFLSLPSIRACFVALEH